MDDPSGIDLAEAFFTDDTPGKSHRRWRLWDCQWDMYQHEDTYQSDLMARSMGKALALTTPIPTPNGWTTMGALVAGDVIFDEMGLPTTVITAFEVNYGQPCREVEFGDGEVIVADEGHLWQTWDKRARAALCRGRVRIAKSAVRTTAEIAGTLRANGEINHSIPLARALACGERDLPLDPYFLGVWLGDGTSRNAQITSGDAEIVEELRSRGFVVTKLTAKFAWAVSWPGVDKHSWKTASVSACLRQMGLLQNKHIPLDYLRADEQSRRDLLAGLMDSDGHLTEISYAEVTQKNELIARGLLELLRSLGEKPIMRKKTARINGVDCGPVFRVRWKPVGQPAKLPRKARRFIPSTVPTKHDHRIVAVRSVASVPVRCIVVDSPNHLFLAGESMIPTHNSVGVIMRASAFPLNFPGQEMLITAPELNHLSPIVDKVEEKFKQIRFLRELLPDVKGGGIKHQPQFQATFTNGARIMGRLPQRTGVGVKGSVTSTTTIFTKRGIIPVEKVVVGDEVFTHMGRWRPVEHVVSYFNPDVVTVNGGGHRGLGMSTNHRMLARRNLAGPKEKRNLAQPNFLIPAEELELNFYFGSPTVFEPEPIHPLFDSPERCALAGAWVADGCFIGVEGNKRISITDDVCEEARQGAIIRAAGYGYSTFVQESGAMRFTLSSAPGLADALRSEFGNLAGGKHLPVWLLGAPEAHRRAWLDAYLAGDGHWDGKRGRWTASTASKELAVGLRLLGQSLGWACAMSWVDPKVTHIMGVALKAAPQRSYRVTFVGEKRDAITDKDAQWMKVRSITPAEPQMVYDLHVKDDHSYLADGLFSHNQHPLVIEQDEGQDYPLRGWTELIETMRAGIPGAQWRVHGVSNGVRDMYYNVTSGEGDLPFYVHKYPAMYRPTWSDEERRAKIAIYGGSRDNPDYKRNIYGEPGDVSNKVFVLARLMACVRINESSWASDYNDNVYCKIKIEGESLERRPIESFITLPASHLHKSYTSYWAGMDLGFTNDPSELLIYGVIRQKRNDQEVDVLRLLTRIHLMRVSAVDQEKVVASVLDFYGDRLRAVSLDKTGAGLPIWQHMEANPELRAKIKGYGFSEKRPVEFDDRPLVGRETQEDAVIEKNIIEFATDKLREIVDAQMMELPYDKELLTEFQGQVVVYSRESNGSGGRRTRYGGGSFHTLDGAKLMILGKELEAIEAALAPKRRRGPVLDGFLY